MCTVCGCGGGAPADGPGREGRLDHDHDRDHGHRRHDHDHHHHDHPHHHGHHDPAAAPAADAPGRGLLDFGGGLAGVHVPGLSQRRIVRIEQDILAENDRYAAANRALLRARGVLALNLMSSPGAGKTTLLVRTAEHLAARLPVAVIEGDQQTTFDAERIGATGVPAVQINTGRGCHLDAHMVGHALADLSPAPGGVLFIENVGNLVCPAAFDLGEAARVVMLSVTEGDDKPLKYPDMFHAADLVLLTKVDLLPYVPFDADRFLGFARRVNPGVETIRVSALTGAGLEDWYAWLERRRAALAPASAVPAAADG